jgi:NAD(P)-dependent dehydrogenase (short-subunit alcohol dehydrogenase family)
MTLKDKIILVTGGSGLIGSAIISDIKEKGGIPINLDLDTKTNLDNGQYSLDLTNDQAVYEAVSNIKSKFGIIDGLVNNAYPRTNDWGDKFEDIKPDSWRKNVDIQLNSVFVITQVVLKYMSLKKKGSIVNVASIYGVVANDFTIYEDSNINPPAAYSAIKSGLIGFTKYLASNYGKDNIRINCVSPGGIFDKQNIKFVQNYEKRVPLKRMGTPEDIAPSISFLLSDEAKYITGHNLIVDGGWTVI